MGLEDKDLGAILKKTISSPKLSTAPAKPAAPKVEAKAAKKKKPTPGGFGGGGPLGATQEAYDASPLGRAAQLARQLDYQGLSRPGAQFSNIQKDPVAIEAARAAAGAAYGGSAQALAPTAGAAGIKPIHEVKWKEGDFNLQNANAPSWWKPLVPKDDKDAERPDVQFLMMLNTMIPYLSPEDQRNAAAQIYAAAADAFSYYKPDKIDISVPVSQQTKDISQQAGLTTIDRNYFQSTGRATGAIDALSQLREQTVQGNRWKLAPGYTWLQQVLGAAEQFGGVPGSGQTRSQYMAMQGALDPLLAQAGTAELGGIGAVGRLFAQPFFSQQALRPTTQGPGGRTFFGQPTGLLAF